MATSLEEIEIILKEHKKELAEKYRIKEIGIFGSYARGEQKRKSDVDIFVDFNDKNIPDLLTLIEIERYISKLLKRKVDLGLKRSLRKELKKKVLAEAVYL